MSFNILSWCQKGRDFGRGSPPPRGSIEYVAVGDMWDPEPPRSPAPFRPSPRPPDRAPAASPAQPPQPRSRVDVTKILVLAGIGYLGLRWVTGKTDQPGRVRVPDAVPGGEP